MKCSRCLDLGHPWRLCRSRIRCLLCLSLGHVKKRCHLWRKPKLVREWRPKALSTVSEPKLQWRPKLAFRTEITRSAEQQSVPTNHDLDSRAMGVDSSASLNNEQEQQNLQSRSHLASIPDTPHCHPQPLENPNLDSTASPDGDDAARMANFLINPQPFLVSSLTVERG